MPIIRKTNAHHSQIQWALNWNPMGITFQSNAH